MRIGDFTHNPNKPSQDRVQVERFLPVLGMAHERINLF
jgi:hypothetical protein